MLTLIIPVRDWPEERIDFCIDSFLKLSSKTLSEVLVVDFGSTQPVRLKARKTKTVRLLRLEAKTWSLAEAINAGVLSARTELVAKTDADILVSPGSRDAFDRTVKDLEAGAFGLAVTQAVDLHQSMAPADAAAAVRKGMGGLGRLRAKWGQGGLVFFSRATWNRLGGFDSRFTGWGNEDNDFAERVRRSGQRIDWASREDLEIFHMWHPPSYAATGVLSQRLKNQKIAKDDKSIFRSASFRHSNFATLAGPAVLRSLRPLVTLGIATTARPNRNRMIAEAINSFRGQADNDFEILVLDNGSPVEETAILRQKLSRIRWNDRVRIEAMTEGSIPGARNAISQLAEGRYICVVDDDDIALPNRLGDHLRAFQADGGAHGSHGGWIDFDESTGVIERNPGKQRNIATLLKGTGKITAHPASLYRTDVMKAVPYDEAFALGSDFDLALRTANLGFDIKHTNTYLTLRRYHSANVTITGQSNQVSNGASARIRAMGSFSWQKQTGVEEAAKKLNDDAYCRNQMSIDTLAELIPGYTGTWQIFVPISALTKPDTGARLESGAALNSMLVGGREEATAFLEDQDVASPLMTPPGLVDKEDGTPEGMSLLQDLLDIIEGDICTKRSGLNQPLFFRSVNITGLKKAKKIRDLIEKLVNVPVQINSTRQAQLDREAPFGWSAIEIKAGERILQSERCQDLSDLMVSFSRIDSGSLLKKAVWIMSDYDDDGEAYYLATPSIRGYDELRALKFDLERHTRMRFRHVASNGVPSELTLSARSH